MPARKSVRLLESIGSATATLWPWYQYARLLWRCGRSEEAVAVYRDLPQSPAWSELAQPAVEFFTRAFSLPKAPERVALALEAMPVPQGHTHFDANDKAYWTALAWVTAGKAERVKPLVRDLQVPPFTLHAASIVALKLRAQAGGSDVSEVCSRAEALLAAAPPLEAAELREALKAVGGGA